MGSADGSSDSFIYDWSEEILGQRYGQCFAIRRPPMSAIWRDRQSGNARRMRSGTALIVLTYYGNS